MRGALVERLSWPEVAGLFRAGWPVLLPVGAAAKEHGRHLPMATDRIVADALARRVAERLPVAVLPTVAQGHYPAFVDYAGSQSLSAATFTRLICELLDGLVAQGARRIAVLNTGVSTEGPIAAAQREALERHALKVPAAHIRELGRSGRARLRQRLGGHADEAETAIMLVLAPELVRLERAAPDYGGELDAASTVFRVPARLSTDPAAGVDFSPTGARGDPTLATPALGAALLAEIVDRLVAGLRLAFPGVDALPDFTAAAGA